MSTFRDKRLVKAIQLRQQGRFKDAEVLLDKILKTNPGDIVAQYQLAQLRADTKSYNEAYYLLANLLEGAPYFAEAHLLMGRIQRANGSNEAALNSYERAIELGQNSAEILFERGLLLERLNRQEGALESYNNALKLSPNVAAVWCNQSGVLSRLGRFEEALISIETALKLSPNFAYIHFNQANTLRDLGRFAQALTAYDRALELDPHNIDALNNRANVSLECGNMHQALDGFSKIIEICPGDPRGHYGSGLIFLEQSQYEKAIIYFERAKNLDMAFADARHSLALARLYSGDFQRGWLEYESRLEQSGFRSSLRKNPQSLDLYERLLHWGSPEQAVEEPLAIWCEQGIGDQLLFSTLLQELVSTGKKFIYEVDNRLIKAYKRVFPTINFIALSEPPATLAKTAKTAIFAGSLPALFRTSAESFSRQPQRVLRASPALIEHYRERLGPGFKVALSWRSTRAGRLGRSKSAPLADFVPLLSIPGVQGVDIQYGDTAEEREVIAREHGIALTHFNEVNYYDDLEDVLAILEACDLLITTSNTSAHLGGALGKPVWLLYPSEHAPFHYWAHRGGHKCLWYPSVEIISGKDLTDWNSLIQHTAYKLSQKFNKINSLFF